MICFIFYIDDCFWGVFVIVVLLGIVFCFIVVCCVVVFEFCDDYESWYGFSVFDFFWLEFVVIVL